MKKETPPTLAGEGGGSETLFAKSDNKPDLPKSPIRLLSAARYFLKRHIQDLIPLADNGNSDAVRLLSLCQELLSLSDEIEQAGVMP